jgi:hypothetical protein
MKERLETHFRFGKIGAAFHRLPELAPYFPKNDERF